MAAALLMLLVLTACSQALPNAPVAEEPPAGLDRFYDQELAFEPCDDYATTAIEAEAFAASDAFECTRMEVPLDYDEPDGTTAQIAGAAGAGPR